METKEATVAERKVDSALTIASCFSAALRIAAPSSTTSSIFGPLPRRLACSLRRLAKYAALTGPSSLLSPHLAPPTATPNAIANPLGLSARWRALRILEASLETLTFRLLRSTRTSAGRKLAAKPMA